MPGEEYLNNLTAVFPIKFFFLIWKSIWILEKYNYVFIWEVLLEWDVAN